MKPQTLPRQGRNGSLLSKKSPPQHRARHGEFEVSMGNFSLCRTAWLARLVSKKCRSWCFFYWVWLNIGWNWHHSCSGVYVWRCLHMSCAFRSCVKSGWNRVQRARALCTCKSRFHGSSDFPAEHLDLKSYEVVGFAGFNLKRVYLGRWFGPLQLRAKLSTAMYDFAGCTEPPTWSGMTSFRKRDWRNSAAIPEASGSPSLGGFELISFRI